MIAEVSLEHVMHEYARPPRSVFWFTKVPITWCRPRRRLVLLPLVLPFLSLPSVAFGKQQREIKPLQNDAQTEAPRDSYPPVQHK